MFGNVDEFLVACFLSYAIFLVVVGRISYLGFVCGEFARLAAEACDAGERLRVQREHHCRGEGRRGRSVEIILIPL